MTTSALPTPTTAATPVHRAPPAAATSLFAARARAMLAIALGVALTLAMQGYQFGKSNHTVYLIDAIRHAQPHLLQSDWFATQTLQYHAAFGILTRWLMKLGIIEPAFLIGHVGLAVLLHAAWWRIVRALGGGAAAFVLSEVLFHALGGGTGLGMYQFLQDGAFLPSNIASVAFLWGVALFLTGRRGASAVLFGVSGLFHLNYAIVAPAAWVVLAALAWWRDRRRPTAAEWLGAAAVAGLCLTNIAPAAVVIARRDGRMPLREFIDLYVHLRHPHHYAPLTWPLWLWASFFLPIPFALAYWARRYEPAVVHASRAVGFISLLLAVALLGAGIAYASETLVQLSLWRFSVFVKMLTCAGAAMWLVDMSRRERPVFAASACVAVAIVAACAVRGPYLGFFRAPQDDGDFLAACDWIRANTPADATFLVPPSEQEFRVRAQRAIVVNFKTVPQLSGEMGAWRDRLEAVLDLPDLRALPTPFPATLAAIRQRYDALPPEHLVGVARRFGARYVLVHRRLPPSYESARVEMQANAPWFLYDFARHAIGTRSSQEPMVGPEP